MIGRPRTHRSHITLITSVRILSIYRKNTSYLGIVIRYSTCMSTILLTSKIRILIDRFRLLRLLPTSKNVKTFYTKLMLNPYGRSAVGALSKFRTQPHPEISIQIPMADFQSSVSLFHFDLEGSCITETAKIYYNSPLVYRIIR